jgi:hypothetical protein
MKEIRAGWCLNYYDPCSPHNYPQTLYKAAWIKLMLCAILSLHATVMIQNPELKKKKKELSRRSSTNPETP